jgi:hypothetical protein
METFWSDNLYNKYRIVYLHDVSNYWHNFFVSKCSYYFDLPIPVAARSKVWVCGQSLAGTAGSNPTFGTDICLL